MLICNDERAANIWRVFHQSKDSELSAISELIHDEHLEWLEYLARFIKQGRKQGVIADKAAKKDPLPAATLAVVLGIISSVEMLGEDTLKLKQHIKQTLRAFLFGLDENR